MLSNVFFMQVLHRTIMVFRVNIRWTHIHRAFFHHFLCPLMSGFVIMTIFKGCFFLCSFGKKSPTGHALLTSAIFITTRSQGLIAHLIDLIGSERSHDKINYLCLNVRTLRPILPQCTYIEADSASMYVN